MTYDLYSPKVFERIHNDMQEIRDLADSIKIATNDAEILMINPPIDSYEWERCMNRIHEARKKIRWIICDKRGRFN